MSKRDETDGGPGAAQAQAGAPEPEAPAGDEPAGKAPAEVEEAQGEAEEAPGEEERRPLTDEERARLYRQQLKQLHVVDVARDVMLTLVTVGYQKMGLTDETRELRDLDDARLSIELLRGMVSALEGVADQEEIETYRSTLAQMQINYARVAS